MYISCNSHIKLRLRLRLWLRLGRVKSESTTKSPIKKPPATKSPIKKIPQRQHPPWKNSGGSKIHASAYEGGIKLAVRRGIQSIVY